VNKRYVIRLTDEERGRLEGLTPPARQGPHTQAALRSRTAEKTDASEGGPASWTDERIASIKSVAREERGFCEEGLEVALMPPRSPLVTGGGACSTGRPRRTGCPGVSPSTRGVGPVDLEALKSSHGRRYKYPSCGWQKLSRA
jgi:hypothetical protein